jgi:hypothetical protein
MVSYIIRGALLTGLVTLAGAALADPVPTGGQWDKLRIQLGGFTSRSSSEITLNNTNSGVGVAIDLENTLNVQSKFDTVRLDALYRWGQTERHQIEFHYFESNRSGTRTLSQNLEIGDITYPAGATLNTGLDLSFANVDYAYAVLQDDRVRLALSAGLHVTGIGLKINSDLGSGFQEEESFTAPLPVIGFRFDVATAKNWKLLSRVDLFYLEYDEFTGGLADTYFGVEWNPFKHVGFGLGYNNVVYRVEAEGTDAAGLGFSGKVDMNITGLLLYAKYFF